MKRLLFLCLLVAGCSEKKPFNPADKYADAPAPKVGEKWWFSSGNPYDQVQTNTILQVSNDFVLAVNTHNWTNSMPIIYYKVGFHKVP